jgi:hypothetical protein
VIAPKRVIPNHELKSHEGRDAPIQSDCPPQLDPQLFTPLNKRILHNHISLVTSDVTKLIIAYLLVPLVLTLLKRSSQIIHPPFHPLKVVG